jgi:hypothetical protein
MKSVTLSVLEKKCVLSTCIEYLDKCKEPMEGFSFHVADT